MLLNFELDQNWQSNLDFRFHLMTTIWFATRNCISLPKTIYFYQFYNQHLLYEPKVCQFSGNNTLQSAQTCTSHFTVSRNSATRTCLGLCDLIDFNFKLVLNRIRIDFNQINVFESKFSGRIYSSQWFDLNPDHSHCKWFDLNKKWLNLIKNGRKWTYFCCFVHHFW